MINIYTATFCFLILGIVTLRSGLYLPAFYVLCYMLPFLPLLAALGGMDSAFWTGDRFTFAPDSDQVNSLSQVWLVSSLGMLAATFTSRVRINRSPQRFNNNVHFEAPTPLTVLQPSRILIVFISTAALVFFRFLTENAEDSTQIHSVEMIVCLMLLLCWTITFFTQKRLLIASSALLTALYVWSQLQSGDRDFFLIFIALTLLFATRYSRSWLALLGVGTIGAVLISVGTIVSMTRMNVPISWATLLEFLSYNSWNATILPVILMIEEEWGRNMLLYGKTYVDLIASVPPSPFFSIFEIIKPIQSDNPADWFYITGLGGMHAAGIALRNFGLIGVFIQASIFMHVLSKFERKYRKAPSLWKTFLYLCLAGTVMHMIWYGLIYIINAGVLFVMLYCLLSVRISSHTPQLSTTGISSH